MPISIDHAFRRGMVSPAARNRALTRSKGSASMGLKGRVVGDMSSKATDEKLPDKGVIPKNEINNREQQHTTKIGKGWVIGIGGVAGAGNYRDKGGEPTADAINQHNKPKFPKGAKVKRGNLRYRTRGNSGGSDTNGPAGLKGQYYGSTETNKWG